jgi:hypothetical protein
MLVPVEPIRYTALISVKVMRRNTDKEKEQMRKTCRKCNIEKDIDLFPKRDIDTYRNDCKDCFYLYKKERYNLDKRDPSFRARINEQGRKYKKDNKDKVLASRKIYYQQNRDKELSKSLEYYNMNKDKKMDRRRQYRIENREVINFKDREHRRSNPLHRLKCNLRTLIGNSLSEKGYSKKSKTEQILGCSFVDFKNHIESLFLPNMNWNNRDEWHIDHVVPLDFAIDEKEILELNHFSNLRPLWISDNLEKSNIITEKTEIYYKILNNRV